MDNAYTAEETLQWRLKWSIAVYAGPSPLALSPVGTVARPVLTAADVTDLAAYGVADPFLLRVDHTWYLFFEVVNKATGRGEIAFATSADGYTWQYGAVVLRETFHLSYPFVFHHGDAIYMVPETRQAACVRLYRAQRFPHDWRPVDTLLRGPYADSTLLYHEGRWWLFAQRGLDELRLWHSEDLQGPWHEHCASPLWPGNRRYSRPAGRILAVDGQLVRFAQDAWPAYGSCVHAMAITQLSTCAYGEELCAPSPILQAMGAGWNASAMHHLDAIQIAPAHWLAVVDGASTELA